MEALIDLTEFDRDERIPYWADVWESAIVLAEDLSVSDGRGLTLLELGCGLGLPSLVAARQGYRVVASDYELPALEGVVYNAEKNGFSLDRVRVVDWRDPPADLGTFDRVVAADVLYERHHPAALADVVKRSLVADGVALVADPGRAAAAHFAEACERAGLSVERRPARRPHGAADGPRVETFLVRRRA
jgi:predicted nicotinamide N-methyase